MLSRKTASAAGAAAATLLALAAVSAFDGDASATPMTSAARHVLPAVAAPSCTRDPQGNCTISQSAPGQPGSTSSGPGKPGGPGGPRVCTFRGVTVPCTYQGGDYGGDTDGCYYKLWPKPWPDGPWNTDPNWSTAHPSGSVYNANCLLGADPNGNLFFDGVFRWKWLDNPPGGPAVPRITPDQAARDFIATLKFDGPTVNLAPPAGATVLVGAPMWLWSPNDPDHWGPKIIGPVAFEGYDISLKVWATSITWSTGDGATFDCDHGAAPGQGGAACTHTYSRSSADAAGQTYQVQGTTHWNITWQAGGQNNFNAPIAMAVQSNPVAVRVGEAQAVVQH